MEHSRCEGKRAQVFLPQHLNISVDTTTPPRPRTYFSYQKKRDTGIVLMFFVTALVVRYAHLDYVGVHE